MYCSHCGTEVPDESAFCPSCGVPVTPPAPSGAPEAPASRRAWLLAAGGGVLAVAAAVVVMLLVVQPFGGGDGKQPGGPTAPSLQQASVFALEYVSHAINDDQTWLEEHTTPGYYDFSGPWFRRLKWCESTRAREGSVDGDETPSVRVVSVVFDPPCEPEPSTIEVGTTFTLRFEDASVTSADVRQALADLSHEEAQVLTTSDGAFIIRTAELEGLTGPPIGPAPSSERDIIEQALRDSLSDFQVLNFNQFASAGDTGSYACVLLRVEGNQGPKAAITRWPINEGDCSPDSPRFASGFGEPSLGPAYVLLEADNSRLPPGTDVDAAMEGVAELLLRRADSFGAPVELRREGSNRLSAMLRGIDPVQARELLVKTAQLEFRSPVLDESRSIICETEDGSTYALPFAAGLFAAVREDHIMTCPPSEEGWAGFVRWEPATGTDSQGMERVLTGGFLRPNATVVSPPPAVLIEFTAEGSLLFEQITTSLVGLPLGIFLDEELIGAPTVQQAISGGRSTVIGLDFDEARRLAIQLNAGALPVPVRVLQVVTLAGDSEQAAVEEPLVASPDERLIAVLAAPDVQTIRVQPADFASLASCDYHWSGSVGAGALLCSNLAPLRDGRVYQVWFLTESDSYPGGSFKAGDGTGQLSMSLEDLPEGPTAIGLAIQDADGAQEPSEMFLLGEFAR